MSDARLDYDEKLRDLVSKWEDSLESNHHDYVYVDGEEGDYGIVRYFGKDIGGTENVHLMTKYIHGGDSEESFYTLAGADVVKKIYRDNFEACLHKSLEANIDPGSREGMYVGFVQETDDAVEIAQREGRSFEGCLDIRHVDFFPSEIRDGAVYKNSMKFYVAVVSPPQGEGQQQKVHFYNLVKPHERLAIKLDAQEHQAKSGLFHAEHGEWRAGFVGGLVEAVVLGDAYSDPSLAPTIGPLFSSPKPLDSKESGFSIL